MKITQRQLRKIIKEEKALAEAYNSMSPRSKSLANAAKRQFNKDYPDVQVSIDGREGWIIVNGKKAVNMSQASGRPLSIEDIIDQMKQAYLGHDMLSQEVPELTGARRSSWQVRKEKELGESVKITKKQLLRVIKEMTISADEAEAYLRDRAASYKRDGLQGQGMKMLLQDDFLDDLGHQHNIEDYEWLIDELTNNGDSPPQGIQGNRIGESKMKITKKQLRRIIKEEKAKLNEMGPASNNERIIGSYFPVAKLEQLSILVDEIYEDAWDAAADDLGPDEEIDMMISDALRVIFLRQTNKRR